MNIAINIALDAPIYRQLYDGIRGQIMNGDAKSGEMLPPIRTVASQLGISVITVKKAWEELERDGLIVTAAGKGCFVASLHDIALDKKRMSLLTERIKTDISYYCTFGLDKAVILDLITQELDRQSTIERAEKQNG